MAFSTVIKQLLVPSSLQEAKGEASAHKSPDRSPDDSRDLGADAD